MFEHDIDCLSDLNKQVKTCSCCGACSVVLIGGNKDFGEYKSTIYIQSECGDFVEFQINIG